MARIIAYLPAGEKSIDVCVSKNYFQIGRHPVNDLEVEDMRVSRFHATIFKHKDSFYVLDHSTNGTYLQPGQQIPRMTGYKANTFQDKDTICALLDIIDDSEQVDLLVSDAQKLADQDTIEVGGFLALKFLSSDQA